MHRSRSWILPAKIVTLAFISLALFAACAPRPEMWAVVLWSTEDHPVTTGSIVAIYESSQLNNTFTIGIGTGKERDEFAQWRLEAFKRKRDAESFAAVYAQWSDMYGKVNLDRLRVREAADAESAQLYKLRSGEIVKILTKLEETAAVGEYKGHWYEVITGEGVRGYTFDEYLEVNSSEALLASETPEEADEFLERFYGTVFRPDTYREMKSTGRYDLANFLPEYGVFADAEKRLIKIVTFDQAIDFEYDHISRPTENSYAFVGSSLILTVHPGNWFNVIYADENDTRYSKDFVYFLSDIEELASLELERRHDVLLDFIHDGSVLESSAYGTIIIEDDGAFEWKGFDRLVPDVVSSEATETGVLEFSLYLDDELITQYDGGIVMHFFGADPEIRTDTIRFLYTFGNRGVRLTLVPEASLNNNVVQQNALSSTILFFTYNS